MTFTSYRCSSAVLAGALAFGCALSVTDDASAGFVPPPLHFSLEVNGVTIDAYEAMPTVDLGTGQFLYSINSASSADFAFNPTFAIASGSPTEFAPAGIITAFAFQNLSNANLDVVITFTIDTSFAGAALAWETNANLSANAGTTVTPLLGNVHMWQVSVDGAPLGGLFAAPFIGGGTPLDESALGLTPGPNSSLTLQIAFNISGPNGQVSFNGNFLVIPGPAGLALLAVGGFAGRSRRRR